MTVPAPTATRESPLATTITRANTLTDWCEVSLHLPPPGTPTSSAPAFPAPSGSGSTPTPGWTVTEALLSSPAGFTSWRAELAIWLREHYGDAPERTTGGYVMSWYLSTVGLLGGTLFHLARRVPSLRPADVAIRVGTTGRPHVVGVALLTDEFACLPDDPARDHPSATVVADDQALAALLRARFAAHAARFVTTFGPMVRFGRRQLWAAATDALDSAAWNAGQLCGDEAAGVADAALLLPDKTAPFTSASTLRATGTGWTRRRESCCFHFALPDAEVCATCPRQG
ncbi:(2Fe-2S)-binding protein [Actinosynnema sp. NPDC047251]|uniref:Ferric siderophore reductase C-terminal domain-containing protein n=1 Tax=Saccharothrix espanaensis (strain ATCC 51144 / DSM 44229 / JCM 9112 / NBRC 15066 / NRRL 15764) TaxID=1179773 RepID=K0JQ70_SACES|nr:(2Fe-2S)-binding protein [Saccharothrix espanaensis]CCH27701.1 hypothetical protein BN6_03700 [Saccharothrix espanaensis DSM 44229]